MRYSRGPHERGTYWSRGDDCYRVARGHKRGEIYVILFGRFIPGRRWSLLGLLGALAVAIVALPGTASAKSPSKSKGKAVGRVYTETNSPKRNGS